MPEHLSAHVRLGDDHTSVVILDQTLLPNREEYLTLRGPEEIRSGFYAQPMALTGSSATTPTSTLPTMLSSPESSQKKEFAAHPTPSFWRPCSGEENREPNEVYCRPQKRPTDTGSVGRFLHHRLPFLIVWMHWMYR